jgi:hypothetical protein
MGCFGRAANLVTCTLPPGDGARYIDYTLFGMLIQPDHVNPNHMYECMHNRVSNDTIGSMAKGYVLC